VQQAGDGFFAPPLTSQRGGEQRSVALGDLNGDGVLDIALALRDSNEVGLLLSQP
jgi:hypothetical protein